MTKKELYRLLLSGHGRAAKFILENGVDRYADLIAKAMLAHNPVGDKPEGRYWIRFANAMDGPTVLVNALVERSERRMPEWRRRRLVWLAEEFVRAGYTECRPILRDPRSKRALADVIVKEPIRPATNAEELIAYARGSKQVNCTNLREFPVEEKLKVIRAAMAEPDEAARAELLRSVRRLRTVPIDFRPLIEWARSPNKELRHWSTRILNRVSHPAIRALALELAAGDDEQLRYAGDLMEGNWLPGDAPMMREWFDRNKSSFTRHSLGMSLRHIESQSRAPEWTWVPALVYNEIECSECQGFLIHDLAERGELPIEWAEEGLFHSIPYVVKACRAYLRRRKVDISELSRLSNIGRRRECA